MNPYAREPLEIIDGIPIFSIVDEYVENYQRIALDHLANVARTGQNPWMPEGYRQTIEALTSAQLNRFVPAGSMVLDAGVGTGRMLALHDYIGFGLDISLDYLKVARSKGITVCFARIEDMPYRDGLFDAVICTDVLEHVIDLNLCLSLILGVLRPGGYLVIRSPSREDMSQYLVELPYRFIHLRLLDGPMLRIFLDRVFGLETVDAVTAHGEIALVARKP